MDGSVLAVLAAYQSNLVSSKNDDVTSGSMSTPPNAGKSRLLAAKELKHATYSLSNSLLGDFKYTSNLQSRTE